MSLDKLSLTLYDPVSPGSYDRFQSPTDPTFHLPSSRTANPKIFGIDDPGLSAQLSQPSLLYEDSQLLSNTLKEALLSSKAAANQRTSEAKLFSDPLLKLSIDTQPRIDSCLKDKPGLSKFSTMT